MSNNDMVNPNTTPPNDDLPEWLQDATGGGDKPHSDAVPQRFSTGMVIGLVVVLAIIGVIGYAMIDRERQKDTPKEGPAPDFAVTMYDFNLIAMPGESVSRDALIGQAYVINFWASYCIPCQREAAMLERIWQTYRDRGVIFLGINTEDPEKDALDYLVEYGITFPNAPDRGARMEKAYRITGIPETFVIDINGDIVAHFLSEPNERALTAAIDRALSAAPKGNES